MKNYRAGGKAPTWPKIAIATLAGPEYTGNALRYTFNRAIGSKG